MPHHRAEQRQPDNADRAPAGHASALSFDSYTPGQQNARRPHRSDTDGTSTQVYGQHNNAENRAGAPRSRRPAAKRRERVAARLASFGIPVQTSTIANLSGPGQDDDYLFDLVVMTCHLGVLVQSVRRHLNGSDLHLRTAHGRRGLIVYRDRTAVAVIGASHAWFFNRRMKPIHGNFLAAGKHWGRLRTNLLALQGISVSQKASVARPRPTPAYRRTAAPPRPPLKVSVPGWELPGQKLDETVPPLRAPSWWPAPK